MSLFSPAPGSGGGMASRKDGKASTTAPADHRLDGGDPGPREAEGAGAVNAKAAFLTIRHAARHMRDGGRIVDISTLRSPASASPRTSRTSWPSS
ncbi:hypothetical protein AB0G15_01380 [Streptosporangium sp. NPDC023825]|uniref:hypothetical protein n=1 Tax=Streptosporangium sp. NPDC023825 TaxID=3154909 RepID=UPI0034348DB0